MKQIDKSKVFILILYWCNHNNLSKNKITERKLLIMLNSYNYILGYLKAYIVKTIQHDY